MKKILIVGGGIAGPTLAIQLKKHGVECEVTLIEQAPEFKNIGYGIAVWGNGRNILREIGIDDDVIARGGYEMPWEAFENKDHKVVQVFSLQHFQRFGSTIAIPRAVLHKTLIEQLDPGIIKLNTKIVTIHKNSKEGVDVELSDGSTHHYDLLVAADGVHSWTREHIFGSGFVKPYGYSFWLFWMPPGFTLSRGAVGAASDGKLVFSYPVQDSGVVMLGMCRKPGEFDDPETRKERLIEYFKEFGQPVRDMISGISSGKDMLYSEASYVSLPEWYKDRVVLIGDAKHAISPLTGMGASLAMEDACVLAQELARQSDIDQALGCFAARRTPRIRKFQKGALLLEQWVMARGFKAWLRDVIFPHISPLFFLKPIERLLQERI